MSRPLYRPEYCDQVIDFVGTGHSIEGFAGHIGVHRDTVYHWKELYPEFAEAMRIAQDKRIVVIEDMLMEIARTGKGNASAAIFIAKNRGEMKDDFGLDHTTKGEKITNTVSDGDFAKLMATYAAHRGAESGGLEGASVPK